MLKKIARKALSLVLAAGVVLSGGISNLYASAYNEKSNNSVQISKQYAQLNRNGEIEGWFDTSDVSAANGKVQVSKTISSTETENVFDINLKVVTTEDIQQLEVSPDAAVVLVMDVSNSMKYDVDGNSSWGWQPIPVNQRRITLAKNAAKNFIDDYTSNVTDGAKRMVSVVQFGSNAETVLGWTDAASVSGKRNVKNTIENDVEVNFSYGWMQSDDGGTNIEGGLMLARNLLNDSKVRDMENVYVVMLTDGVPTYHVNKDSPSTRFIAGTRGGGDESEWEDYKDVPSIAATIKDKASALYTISFATNKTHETVGGQSITKWLNSFATQNFDATNGEELEITFENISQIIQNSAKAWIATDPMGDYILFDEDYNAANNSFSIDGYRTVANYDTKSHAITWNVKKAVLSKITQVQDTKYYEYSLNYRIALDTTAEGFEEGKWYLTNGVTSLTYMLTKDGKIDPTLYSVNFRIPAVRGFLGDFSFVKTDLENVANKLSGAEFVLEGTATGSNKSVSMTADSKTGGSVNFADIPAGVYTLRETKAPAGYEVSSKTYKVTVSYGEVTVEGMEKDPSDQAYIVPNESSKMDIHVEKEWAGVSAGDPLPASVTVTLTRDGDAAFKKTAILNSANDWQADFTDLRKYDDAGNAYVYRVNEDKVNGYTAKVTGNAAEGFVVTNTYDPDGDGNSVNVSGQKTWVDGNNGDNTRPASITVELYADGVKKAEQKVTAENGWNYSFSNLPKYGTDSHEIQYSVKEVAVDGYTSVVNGYNIENTLNQKKISVSGTKTWIDPEGTVHPEITIVLKRDGAEVDRVTLGNGETTYSFNNLDKYDLADGHAYEYTVEELPVEGYTSSQDGYNFTNTINQEKTSVSGTKTWVDPEGTVHPEITIVLKRDGVEADRVTLGNGETTYSFTNLDVYAADGHVYEYTVEELPVEGYTSSQDGYNFTNTINQEKTSVSGTKTWIDPEGTVHPEITIVLKRDGAKVDEVTLANGETAYSFTNLDVYAADGHVYEYTVEELPVEGYTSSQDGYNFTNTINQEKTSVSGTKTWIDPEGTVHPEITIVLNRDGVEADRVTLGNGETTYSFTNLDVYAADGHVYEYTVEELPVEGYTSSQDGYKFTNTINQEKTSVSGTKTWIDPEGTVHPEITIVLKRDGAEVDRVTLGNGETTYSFDDLDKYDLADGHAYEYTVEELPVEGYTSSQDGYKFTNTINQEKTSVSGTKTWIDPEGTVHPEITIVLNRDGVAYDNVVLANGETAYSFDNLDVYAADGHVYEYTVEENSVEGYISQVNGYDIVNTVEQKYFDIRGMKIWENVPEGETLPEITVILYKNGIEIDRAVVSEATYWEYAFEGMEQYDLTTGQENVYTVDEVPVEGYETEINGYDITNTYATEEIPDENTPLDPPEENIPDEDTPLNPPEENIPDEDTPLGPATGQAENLLPVALAAVSATGLFVLTIARKKTVKE